MQRRRNGEAVDLRVEATTITTTAARLEAVNMVGATSAEEAEGGKGT